MQVLDGSYCCILAPRSIHIEGRAAVKEFIYKLTLVHRKLEDEIHGELKRRYPNHIKVLRLKKLRLAVKDRLYRRFRSRTVGTRTKLSS